MPTKIRLTLLVSLCLIIVPKALCLPRALSDSSRPLVFTEFLLLESERTEGKYLALDETTPGVVRYSGGALPQTLDIHPRMYTFKTSFRIDDVLRGRNLALYVGLSEYPYRVYINGLELFAKGRYGDGHYNSSMRAASSVYLSKDLLKYGDPTNELVFEIYPEYETWALDLLYIDTVDEVAMAVFLRNFLGINIVQAAFVLSLILALYFAILFVLEQRRMSKNLYFALICVAFCLAYFNVLVHNEAINEVPLEAMSKAGLVLISTFLLMFCCEFTGILSGMTRTKKHAILTILFVIGISGSLAVLTQGSKQNILKVFGYAMNFLIAPQLLLDIVIMGYALLVKRNRLVIPLLVSFVIVVGTALHDIMYLNREVIPYVWLSPYGYLSYIIAIFAMLVVEQSRLHHQSLQQMADIVISKSQIENLNEKLVRERDSFHRFVPTQFLDLLGKKTTMDVRLGDGSLRYLSVLFSDIRRYSGLSEGMLPKENLEYLNNYLLRMERVIQHNQGFVDKYIGDAILALFPFAGEPTKERKSRSADIAVSGVLEMKSVLKDFNDFMVNKGQPPIDIGVGINTGEVILGTVGSETRLDTTVIGDTVNVASRLESLTKYYRVRCLVSEHTVDALVQPERFAFRLVDHIAVAGRQEGFNIYESLDGDDAVDARKLESCRDFYQAVDRYKAGAFSEAFHLFRDMQERNPGDYVPELLKNRCASYMENPPQEDWNGIFRFSSK